MSFWNYIGLGAFIDRLCRRKSRPNVNRRPKSVRSQRRRDREAKFNALCGDVSHRIRELERQLDHFDPASKAYEDIAAQIDGLRGPHHDVEDDLHHFNDEIF